MAVIDRVRLHVNRTAVIASDATLSHRALADAAETVAGRLLAGDHDLREAPVVYLASPTSAHAVAQWGIWRAGGMAVPLSPLHTRAEWDHVIADSGARLAVADERLKALVATHGLSAVSPEPGPAVEGAAFPVLSPDRRALLLYTSGTTAAPKGVVLTHGNLEAQVTTLSDAWGWTAHDVVLGVLPLHHVHGIVNVLTCALWNGATCELMPRFDPAAVWARFAAGGLTVFMAVPTIYDRLIAAWEAADAATQRRWSEAASRLRLMVSGSAALPVPVLERWREITGHVLLERYGMTEIGMALSNPLHGPRQPGRVGTPLPGVEVRLVDDDGAPVGDGTPGEIEVKGPLVFLEYHRQPEATAAAFHDGWFRSGDVAVREEGAYRILGRRSQDIVKTGGYKVSALEIEAAFLAHPRITECAVVGLPDPSWGEVLAAAVVLRKGGGDLDLAALREWAGERLAAYKLPSRLLCVGALPRNALGKVVKSEVRALFA